MSEASATAFLIGNEDGILLEGARDAPDPITFLVQAGAAKGFDFDADELLAAARRMQEDAGELSEQQLDKVAGDWARQRWARSAWPETPTAAGTPRWWSALRPR